ncbi:hypothetical protein SAMN05877838_3497 [Hoeflea halophila]|uniref:Uncharacterized protein n=1 Tax=Hoeflea halophila TaxID=714899 RepID=A0A286IGT2_9HYPH|nr:hypothetical protein SAMN05877838_3497 [Hoeflea halophila]
MGSPEQYSKYHRHPAKPVSTLQHAANYAQIIAVNCSLCRRSINYLATDLVQVLNPARPVDGPPFSCSRCGTAEYISVKVKTPAAGDYGHLVIRRLLGIRSVSEWGNRPLGEEMRKNNSRGRK